MNIDTTKFISPHQLGGIQQYQIDNGEARGVRICDVNTGGGLRYRVLIDRGLDIDQAFHNEHSLTFLSHKGVTPPTRALDRGMDWLKGFPVGLLTGCGPFNTGAPAHDAGQDWPMHGQHSNTAAEIESIIQPDPHAGRLEMSITGIIRYGGFYGPNLSLRRTISSTLGEPKISIDDTFTNHGNTEVTHAWLLHINFGYPILDEGSEFVFDSPEHVVRTEGLSHDYFKQLSDGRHFPAPSDDHAAERCVFRYLMPKSNASGRARAGLWNDKLKRGIAIDYSTAEFPRLGQWLHWGKREYVAALEPMTAGVEGRDKDRDRGWLRTIAPGDSQHYGYSIEVVTQRDQIL